jgi:hypothetical protein
VLSSKRQDLKYPIRISQLVQYQPQLREVRQALRRSRRRNPQNRNKDHPHHSQRIDLKANFQA